MLALLFGAAGPGTNLGWLATGPGRLALLVFKYGLFALGFIALIWNTLSASSSDARRKIRVTLWGALIGVVPATVAIAANDFFGFQITVWLAALLVLLFWLFPLSFAYAVFKHRVLEIPVLLRRSARYLLVQRGLVFLAGAAERCCDLRFCSVVCPPWKESNRGSRPQRPSPWAPFFGTALLWSGARLHRNVGKRIDRAFFRNSYDARVILEDPARKKAALRPTAGNWPHCWRANWRRPCSRPRWLSIWKPVTVKCGRWPVMSRPN